MSELYRSCGSRPRFRRSRLHIYLFLCYYFVCLPPLPVDLGLSDTDNQRRCPVTLNFPSWDGGNECKCLLHLFRRPSLTYATNRRRASPLTYLKVLQDHFVTCTCWNLRADIAALRMLFPYLDNVWR